MSCVAPPPVRMRACHPTPMRKTLIFPRCVSSCPSKTTVSGSHEQRRKTGCSRFFVVTRDHSVTDALFLLRTVYVRLRWACLFLSLCTCLFCRWRTPHLYMYIYMFMYIYIPFLPNADPCVSSLGVGRFYFPSVVDELFSLFVSPGSG